MLHKLIGHILGAADKTQEEWEDVELSLVRIIAKKKQLEELCTDLADDYLEVHNENERLREELNTLHAAITIAEANWDNGGYCVPLKSMAEAWTKLDGLMPQEHRMLGWAVDYEHNKRKALGGE